MTKPMYNKTDGEGVCKGGERGEREIFKSDGGINPPTKIHQFVWHALFFFFSFSCLFVHLVVVSCFDGRLLLLYL